MGSKHRWQGLELEKLRLDYVGGVPVREIAVKHGTSLGAIVRLSRQHGWPARRPGSLKENRVASAISRQQRRAEQVQAIIDEYRVELGLIEQVILHLQERQDA